MQINRYPINIEGETVSIGTANELAIALDVLQGQYDSQALSQLEPHLAEIIANPQGLMLALRSLGKPDQIHLIQSIGKDLPRIVQSASKFRDQLATMAEQDVEELLLTTLGQSGLRQLIHTGRELAEVLEWVYGECDALLLDLLGETYVAHLCRHASDLSAILFRLDAVLQDRLIDQLGWPRITHLVRDGHDLAALVRALPPTASEKLLSHFSAAELKAIIRNPQDWEYLYQRLEPAEAEFLMGWINRS